MESREDFLNRCTKELVTKGKFEEEARTCCEVAWENRYNATSSSIVSTRKSEFMRTLNQDPRLSNSALDMDDIIIIGAMLYLWSGSSDRGYSYDAYSAPVVDESSIVGSSSTDYSKESSDMSASPVVNIDSDRGSSSSDYSYTPSYSSNSDYGNSSSDYSSNSDYSSSSSDYSSSSSDYSSSSSYD